MCASFSGEKPAQGPAATLLTTPQVDDMVSFGRPGLWPYINLSAKPSQLQTSTFYPPRLFCNVIAWRRQRYRTRASHLSRDEHREARTPRSSLFVVVHCPKQVSPSGPGRNSVIEELLSCFKQFLKYGFMWRWGIHFIMTEATAVPIAA